MSFSLLITLCRLYLKREILAKHLPTKYVSAIVSISIANLVYRNSTGIMLYSRNFKKASQRKEIKQ